MDSGTGQLMLEQAHKALEFVGAFWHLRFPQPAVIA
jgi:hypothetical protein